MKKLLSIFLLLLFFDFAVISTLRYSAKAVMQTGVEELWSNSMTVYDVAVSGNGESIAVAGVLGSPGLFFFASGSSTAIWSWQSTQGTPLSVAISADGGQVATGTSTGYTFYFDDAKTRTGLQTASTWVSVNLGGGIERRTIDMSDNGQDVVVGGTGESVYYFADCRTRSGSSETPTWNRYPPYAYEILAVDLSPDGQYVAAGGRDYSSGGFVALYTHASSPPYPTTHAWDAHSGIDGPVTDVKLSDDGYSVAAVSGFVVVPATLYYWRDASNLSGDPATTWNSTLPYECVDMSADGKEVVTGKPVAAPCGIHFWADATSLTGNDQPETWARHEGEAVLDVGISRDGSILAAAAWNLQEAKAWAYFYTSDGTSIGEFQLDSLSDKVSMSIDGGIVAVGGGQYDSLYVFKISEAVTVGGDVTRVDLWQLLTPFLLCGVIVAAGIAGIIARAKRRPL